MKLNTKTVEFDGLHIGQIVRKAIETRHMDFARVAEKMNVTPTGMHHRMKNPTFSDIYDIIRVSQVLEVDVFTLIFNELNKRMPKLFSLNDHEFNNTKIKSLTEMVEKLMHENKSLYDIIAVYKNSALKEM
ncbi:MAG: hypothetical protein IPO86_10105 [Saprospiraceae bacterium]|nr:hypothetical protein [Saprospiraceae bacterium]MBK9728459.1 hypothetical protein [Saprospiraceae bacterium]